jgi:hypothetical protein
MIEDMTVRNFVEKTHNDYIRHVGRSQPFSAARRIRPRLTIFAFPAASDEFWGDQRNARDVAARVRPSLGHASEDWVCAHWRGDNRDYARRRSGRMKCPIGRGDDGIGFATNHHFCQLRHLTLRTGAEINDQIATFDEAARRQVGQYDRTDTAVADSREHADAPDPFRSFCGCRRNCRQHRANEQSPPHLGFLLAPSGNCCAPTLSACASREKPTHA